MHGLGKIIDDFWMIMPGFQKIMDDKSGIMPGKSGSRDAFGPAQQVAPQFIQHRHGIMPPFVRIMAK